MHKRLILIIFQLVIVLIVSHAQPWRLLSRNEKDSVIYNHFNKGNMYSGLGLGGSQLSGGWHGFAITIKPAFGYYIFNRQLTSLNILFEQAETSNKGLYKKSQQLRAGIFYRYYLPERRILHLFFSQVGLIGGKFKGSKNLDGVVENIEVTQITFSVGFGIN